MVAGAFVLTCSCGWGLLSHTKKTGACHNCNEVGHSALECPKNKESNNASSSSGGDVHCLTYTDELVPLDHDAC